MSDITSAAQIADTIRQQSTIITIAINTNNMTLADLQPISSGVGFAFNASIDQLSSLTPSIIDAICGLSCMNNIHN